MITAEQAIEQYEALIWMKVGDYVNHHAPSQVVEPDDLFQAACEKVVSKIHMYDPARGSLGTFVGLISERAIDREYRSSRGEKTRTGERLIEGRQMHTSEMHLHLTDELADNSAVELEMDIKELPARQRFIIHAVNAGWTFREIGDALSMSHENARLIYLATVKQLNFNLGLGRNLSAKRIPFRPILIQELMD